MANTAAAFNDQAVDGLANDQAVEGFSEAHLYDVAHITLDDARNDTYAYMHTRSKSNDDMRAECANAHATTSVNTLGFRKAGFSMTAIKNRVKITVDSINVIPLVNVFTQGSGLGH